jgi:hypothetical protein
MKNYINFVNDHSGSMADLATAAAKDFNTNIEAVKNAASQEMLDTVVSVVEVDGHSNPLSVTVSNPHVLKPVTNWRAESRTPLWGSTAKLIDMLLSLPDIRKDDVSVLVMMTTDGEATDGVTALNNLRQKMAPLLATGRWTFVARVPKNLGRDHQQNLLSLGIPEGNLQSWDTTAAGMAVSTAQTTAAMGSYFAGRSAGVKATSSFYANAAAVNLALLEDISKKVSLYVVPMEDNGVEIRPFILRHRMDYLKGAAFYQLSKTESKVSYTKQVLVRDQASGKIFAGAQARSMIGLPSDRNARLHPGDHKAYDIFIQSESVNRKLVGGSGVIYWKEIGVPFTEADLAYLQPKVVAAAPAPVQLISVPVTNRPTKSPIPVTPMRAYFETREEARQYCGANGIVQSLIEKQMSPIKGKRWAVPAARQAMTA